MSPKEPTWFVRLQGHILGPLSTEQLKASLREGEISLGDKINRSGENSWQVVGDHHELAAYWKTHRARAPAFEIPSPNILWKKPPPQAEEAIEPAIREAMPSPIPEPPVTLEAVEVPAEQKPAPEKKNKVKPGKKAKARKPEIKVEVAATPEPTPVAEIPTPEEPKARVKKQDYTRPFAPLIEYSQPPQKSEVEKEIIRLLEVEKAEARRKTLEAVAAFPQRPEVPEPVIDYAGPERKTTARQRAFYRNFPWETYLQNKRLRIAAGAALLLIVASVAYYVGQKTRDLKELPLPDPSSPTTQPPAASDPIQPLRAPTRPQRD